jgi:hypothetical protein
MSHKIRVSFLILVVLQALHSMEEYTFKFYDVFPPMVFLYRNAPQMARPAFIVFNLLLVTAGLICLFVWVWPGRRGARTIVLVWIGMESFNLVAHLTWAILIRGYNPGLVTVIGFAPLVIYLSYQLIRAPAYAGAFKFGK